MSNLVKSLVEFDEYIDGGEVFITVYNAKFLQDFGPWSKNDIVEYLTFDYEEGCVEQTDDDYNILKQCFFKLAPDNER